MTHPDDPRDQPRDRTQSWEDGTANPPPERPDHDQPTEVWQPQQYPAGQQYPADQQYPAGQQYPADQQYQQYPNSQPYPTGQPYPDQPTEQYGYAQPPYTQQPNPTQAMPPYDPNQHYAANQQYAGQQYTGQQYTGQQYTGQQYAQQPPTHTGEPPYEKDPGGGSSKKWIVALLALAVLAVVVLAGILFVTNRPSESETTASPGITRTLPPTTTSLPTVPSRPVVPSVPSVPGDLLPGGIPEILGESGAAIGTIIAIDGTTLSLNGIDGAPVTVNTTPQTQIISLSGFDLADLKVGALVIVNGTPAAGGAITADVIVESPNFGG